MRYSSRLSRFTGGNADTSSVPTCVPARPKFGSWPFQVSPAATFARSKRVCGAFGVRTSSHTSASALYLPLVATTWILPLPSCEPDLSCRKPSFSSGFVKTRSVLGAPTGAKRGSVVTASLTSLIDASLVNTDTGSENCSAGPITRGSVGRIISGARTNTDLSVEPYALPSPATTITRTAPTYCGRSTECAAFSPALREKGPRNFTTGGKRDLPSSGFDGPASEPPSASRRSSWPPYAPATS